MADIIHTSEGLTIKRNPVNGFTVCTLHFRADPRKRSAEWRREAATGLTPEQFAKEYDIDYTAIMGSKVFPEIVTHRSAIVVELPYPDFGPDVRYYGGFDYGTRNPSSFHVYTVQDGIVYSVWELYEPTKNITEFVAKMKEFPYWNRIRWISADPMLGRKNQQVATGLISVKELFWNAGVRNILDGRNDPQAEEAWIALIRKAWADPNEIGFKIFSCCTNQIREFNDCIYTPQSERQLLSSSFRETIADFDNHSLDDNKYFLLNLPKQQAPSNKGYDNIALGYGWGRGRTSKAHNQDRGYRLNG